MSKIVVIGAGYVGLVTGACLAKYNIVTIVEKDTEKLQKLSQGIVPFYEPGMNKHLKSSINNKSLIFTNNLTDALLDQPDFIFICVGTPPLPDGNVNLSALVEVTLDIGNILTHACVVVMKSTVPVGTTRQTQTILIQQLKKRKIDCTVNVVSNPEFLKEGTALQDFLTPDRVVVGTTSSETQEQLYELYKPFIKSKKQFLAMSPESSELTKYASNAMLATRISFINEIARLSYAYEANIEDIAHGIGSDPRIGHAFLKAGIGFGGSCLPKDIQALSHMGQERKIDLPLIKAIETTNNEQRSLFFKSISNFYKTKLAGKKAAIWGLAFKPETDDIRCAPSIDLINSLLKSNVHITVYDPVAMKNIKKIFGNSISYATTKEGALSGSDFLVITTEWNEFLEASSLIFRKLSDKTVFDGRNCFKPEMLMNLGITYFCIGKSTPSKSTFIPEQPRKPQQTTSL